MPRNQAKHLFGPRALAEHDRPAVEVEALNARTGERQVVGDRQHQQQYEIAGDPAHLRGGLGVVGVVIVRARNELGHAGGAARELEDAGVFRVGRKAGKRTASAPRRPLDQVRERQFAGAGRAQHNAELEARACVGDARDHRTEREIALALGIDARHRLRDVDELAHLAVAVGRKRRDRDRADLLQGEIEDHELSHVGQLQHDPVERLEAERGQVAREVVTLAIDVRIGEAPLAVDQRETIGKPLEHRRELGRQRLVLPVAARAVALGVLGRKFDDAVQHCSSRRIVSRCSARHTAHPRPMVQFSNVLNIESSKGHWAV